jgi:ubiquinone/menaquinone biosynthesis C-methylase UbiE
MTSANYEVIGRHYSSLRQPDKKIARAINSELAGTETVVNIGAGTGSYEPDDKTVTAVEPCQTMIARRRPCKQATVVRASAENLPFASNSFDASLAILTLQHWNNWRKGIQEAKRVARSKVVLFTWHHTQERYWLSDYFPEIENFDKHLFPTIEDFSRELGELRIIPVAIPWDCSDGFMYAYWARPERYLDSKTRSAISTFSRLPNVEQGAEKLSHDLKSGLWRRKHGHILGSKERDFGYRLVVAEN